MSLEVKICGLKTLETLGAALDAGADHVGFVFFPPSPRNVTLEEGARLARHAEGSAKRVALVVDPTSAELDEIMSVVKPDAIQFHGSEGREFLRGFHSRYWDTEVWKAIPVATQEDLGALAYFLAETNRVLLDAKPPRDADRPGGHGRVFDWTLLRDLDPDLGFMLSGGLTPDNVGEAVRVTRAGAVDVSSGVESAPGVKDIGKIRAFIQAARAAAERKVL